MRAIGAHAPTSNAAKRSVESAEREVAPHEDEGEERDSDPNEWGWRFLMISFIEVPWMKMSLIKSLRDIVPFMMKGHSLLIACAFGLAGLATSPAIIAQPASQSTQDSTARDPHSVQPERPTVATHAGTVARGWVELEEGGEWDKAADGKRSFFAPTNLKIGLASRAQLNLLVNLISDAQRGGSLVASDITIGVKYRIIDDSPILGDFAILPAIKLPSASTTFAGTGTTDFSVLLISSHQLGPVAMDLNAGQTWRGGDGTSVPKTASVWSASFGFPIDGPLGAAAEIFGYPRTTGSTGAKGTTALLIGPTYLARKWLAFDSGIIVPIAGEQPHAMYVGFVWNIGCLAGRRICGERST